MYDTSPLAPFKGETKPFLHVGFDTKTLESLFDLHPSFETSLDFSDYVTGASGVSGNSAAVAAVGGGVGGGSGGGVVVAAAASPPGIPDSAVVTSPVASSPADFPTVTLSSAATSQHLAEIERHQLPPLGGVGVVGGTPPPPATSIIASSSCSSITGSISSSSIAPSHHHRHHHQQQQHHQQQHHHHHQHHSGAAATTTTHFLSQPPQQQMSPGPSVPSTPSPVSHHPHHHPHPHHAAPHTLTHPHPPHQQPQQHHHHHQQQQLQGYPQPVLSPSLSVDDVSQAFSDDSCVFLPEYEQLATASVSAMTVAGGSGGGVVVASTCSSGGGMEPWGAGPPAPFYSTVKTEDMGLASLTACSLETNLPGFTTSTLTLSTSSPSSSSACKMEYESAMGGGMVVAGGAHYSGSLAVSVSPSHSMRTLSESSTGTVSTLPDSPGGSRGSSRADEARASGSGLGKGGSKRRQVPKGSEEYKEKRARNNVAVRKSRAKAKEKQKMTEGRVKELTDQNETLQKKVDMLTKELTVLRRLFVDVGAPLPDDLSKLLPGQSS